MTDSIEQRYDRMLRDYNFMEPPPEGVDCDCDGDPVDEHFHVRCMLAECDECGVTLQEDFFVYTKAAGFAALAEYSRKAGWTVDEEKNYYKCPKH